MGLKEYDVEINGYPTTVLLSDEDARLQGLLAGDAEPEDSTEVAELRAQVDDLAGKLAASEQREREMEAKVEAAEQAKAEAQAKAAEAPANKQAPAPQNKGGSAAANKGNG